MTTVFFKSARLTRFIRKNKFTEAFNKQDHWVNCQRLHRDKNKVTFDGLKALVQFYDNHCQLWKVSKVSGVGMKALFVFLESGVLSDIDREKLEKPLKINS